MLYTGSVEVGVPFLLCLFQFGDFVLVCYRGCKVQHTIGSFSSIFRVQKQTRYSRIQKKRFEHIELPAKLIDYFLQSNKSNINQSLVTSHELSTVSTPLVDRLTLLEGGCSLVSSMRSSLLVWERHIRAVVLPAWPPSSFLPSISLPHDTGGGAGTPTPIGVGSPTLPPVSRGREVEGKKEEGGQADSTNALI